MPDPKGALEAGQPMYSNGFLPAVYQPTMFRAGTKPVLNLDLPPGVSLRGAAAHARTHPGSERSQHAAGRYRIRRADQCLRPGVQDANGSAGGFRSKERNRRKTLEMYGIGKEPTHDYGRRCLMARRLVEKGVRFVCVVTRRRSRQPAVGRAPGYRREPSPHGRPDGPAHGGAAAGSEAARAARRTLVLWGGEFGRSPESEGTKGRDHHNLGFSMWMAGGGIKGGQVVGATDDIGLRATVEPHHLRDIHTTVLHQLG